MRKLFMFLAVAGLATFGASCSKSDDNGGGGNPQLVVSADKSSVEEGTSVTFTAKADGKIESGADFYVEGTKVANPYKFETPGSYKVIAKKANFKDSNAITITVTEKGGEEPQPEKKTLVLTAAPATVEVGQSVTFSVKDNENAAVAGATITLNGATVANPWTATEAGTYKFKATKADYNDSAEVTVTVTEPTIPTENYVKVGANYSTIEETRLYIYTNAQNQALIYSMEDGTPYFMYELVSFTGEEDFSITTMAVILTSQPTAIMWPQDVPANQVVTVEVLYASGGQLVAQSPETEQVTAAYTWGAKSTQTTPGKVNYTIGSTVMDVKFNGDYTGLYASPQSSTLTAKKNYSVKALKNASKVNNLSIAK